MNLFSRKGLVLLALSTFSPLLSYGGAYWNDIYISTKQHEKCSFSGSDTKTSMAEFYQNNGGSLEVKTTVTCPGDAPFSMDVKRGKFFDEDGLPAIKTKDVTINNNKGVPFKVTIGTVGSDRFDRKNLVIVELPARIHLSLNNDYDGFHGTGEFFSTHLTGYEYKCEMIPFPGGSPMAGADCKINKVDDSHYNISYNRPLEGSYRNYYIQIIGTYGSKTPVASNVQLAQQIVNWSLNYVGRDATSVYGSILHGAEPFRFDCYIEDTDGKEEDSRCTVAQNTFIVANTTNPAEHIMVFKDGDKTQTKELRPTNWLNKT